MLHARLAALGVCALLAGCGETRSPGEVARTFVGGDDPAKCDDASQAFLERQSRRTGEAARAACRRDVERFEPPAPVRVTSEQRRGDRAEVRLEAAGQDVLVRLQRRDDRWLVADLGAD